MRMVTTAAIAVLLGTAGAWAADAPSCPRPARRHHVARVAHAPRVVASARAADPELYDDPHRQIVTDRRCVDDGDGVTCRYRRFFR